MRGNIFFIFPFYKKILRNCSSIFTFWEMFLVIQDTQDTSFLWLCLYHFSENKTNGSDPTKPDLKFPWFSQNYSNGFSVLYWLKIIEIMNSETEKIGDLLFPKTNIIYSESFRFMTNFLWLRGALLTWTGRKTTKK